MAAIVSTRILRLQAVSPRTASLSITAFSSSPINVSHTAYFNSILLQTVVLTAKGLLTNFHGQALVSPSVFTGAGQITFRIIRDGTLDSTSFPGSTLVSGGTNLLQANDYFDGMNPKTAGIFTDEIPSAGDHSYYLVGDFFGGVR